MSEKIPGPEDLQPEDYKYILHGKDIDPNFSPEKNRAIVEKTIQQYEANLKRKMDEKVDNYGERADAVVTYLRALNRGYGAHSDLERYFGRQMMAHLRGQQIRDSLMSGMTVQNKQGQIIKPGGR